MHIEIWIFPPELICDWRTRHVSLCTFSESFCTRNEIGVRSSGRRREGAWSAGGASANERDYIHRMHAEDCARNRAQQTTAGSARRAKGWRATAWQSVSAGCFRRRVDRLSARTRGGARIRAKFAVHRRTGRRSVAPEVCASAHVGISTGRAIALSRREGDPGGATVTAAPAAVSKPTLPARPTAPADISRAPPSETPPRGRTGAAGLAREWHNGIPRTSTWFVESGCTLWHLPTGSPDSAAPLCRARYTRTGAGASPRFFYLLRDKRDFLGILCGPEIPRVYNRLTFDRLPALFWFDS